MWWCDGRERANKPRSDRWARSVRARAAVGIDDLRDRWSIDGDREAWLRLVAEVRAEAAALEATRDRLTFWLGADAGRV